MIPSVEPTPKEEFLPSQENSEPSEERLIHLTYENTHDAEGNIKHRFFKSIFLYVTKPYTKMPVYLESYNKATKKFTIIVLYPKRTLDFVPVGYPLIPISEKEAQDLVEHRRNFNAQSNNQKPKPPTMELSSLVNPNLKPLDHPAPANQEEKAPAVTSAPKAQRSIPSKDGRPSIRSIVVAAFNEGKNKEEILPILQSVFPDKDAKYLKSMIAVSVHSLKKDDGTPKPPKEPKAPKEKAPSKSFLARGGRPSLRSIVVAGLKENKPKEDILVVLKEVYPEKEEKYLKSMIYVGAHSLKMKSEKDEAPSPETPSPEQPSPEQPTPAVASEEPSAVEEAQAGHYPES